MGARGLVLCVLVSGVVACSQLVGFDDLVRTNSLTARDGGGDDDDDDDVPVRDGGGTTIPDGEGGAVARCSPTQPFGVPEIVAALNPPSGSSTGLAFSANDLEAVYGVFTGSSFTMRHARRTSLDAAWVVVDSPLPVEIGSPSSISADGLSLYATLGPTEHFVVRRTSTDVAFTNVLSFDMSGVNLNGPAIFVAPSEERAYYAMRGASASESFIAHVPLNGARRGVAGTPTRLNELHVAGADDGTPVTNQAETVLYFNSTRSGNDVALRATRASKAQPFGPTETLSLGVDTFIWSVSNDDCELFVFRNEVVHVARRPR